MAVSNDAMLRALHQADPSTLNKRYTDSQLLAAYNAMLAKKAPAPAPAPAPTPAPAPVAPPPVATPPPVVAPPVTAPAVAPLPSDTIVTNTPPPSTAVASATLTPDQMLRYIHQKDPSTLNNRYSDAELRNEYNKLSGAGAPPVVTAPVTQQTPAATTPAPASTPPATTTPAPTSYPANDEMLRYIHQKDPSTTNNRYSDAELRAAYDKIKGAAPAQSSSPAPAPANNGQTSTTTDSTPAQTTTAAQTYPSNDAMLRALHEKDPSTVNNRYSDADLKAAYDKTVRKISGPGSSGGTPPAGGGSASGGTQGGGGVDSSAGGSGSTGTVDNGGGGSFDTTTAGGIPQDYKDRFDQTIQLGTDYGNKLIDQLGLGGQFIPRVQEGPSDTYYNDLSNLRSLAGNAGNLSPLDNESLDVARAALPGLDAQENAALRSAAVADVDRQFGQAKQQLLRYQGGMFAPAQRAAQIAQLGGARVGAQRTLARDLLIQNIQEKKDARNAFTNLTQQVGSRADSRVQNLQGLLQTGGQFADSLKSQGQQFNASSVGQEVAARTGALVGGVGAASSLLGGYKAEDFQMTALNEALAAKDKEIAAQKAISDSTLAAQERIMKALGSKI